MILEFKSFKNTFEHITCLIYIFISYLPLNYFSFSKALIMLFCLVLLSLILIVGNQKLKEIFHNQHFLTLFNFLGWYTFRLIELVNQIEQVDFISIYIINTLTIFLYELFFK